MDTDSDDSPELTSLRAFYADLDPSLVDSVWHEHDHDYKVCMEVLAEIAKKSSAGAALLRGASGHGQEEPRSPLRPPLSSSVAEVGTSHAAADLAHNPSWKRELPPPQQAADGSWDLTTVASALFDWGNSVSDGITGIADNISDFVSDLASAFDAGWDDGQEYAAGTTPASASERNRAVVMAGGMDSQRVNNRRHPGTAHPQQTTKVDAWDGEEDEKKDA